MALLGGACRYSISEWVCFWYNCAGSISSFVSVFVWLLSTLILVVLCFVSCSSFPLAGLVPSGGCGCLLSGVEDVFPCFCALCIDLCAVAWVSFLDFSLFGGCALASLFLYLNVLPSLGVVLLLFRISDCSVLWACHLFCLRFWFLFRCKNFKGVEHFSFSFVVNYVHYFIHWDEGEAFFNDV